MTSRILPINATPTETSTTKLHGLIISLQFSDNGSASWIVSSRWRVDINYDINGVVPQSIKNLNVSVGMISADGLVTKSTHYLTSRNQPHHTTNKRIWLL
ncbi:MAG: hypothetical protein ACHQXG_11180 [Nitrososphaerales archaeon]